LGSTSTGLDQSSQPGNLVKVVTGRIAPETVNAHDAVDIGSGQLTSVISKELG